MKHIYALIALSLVIFSSLGSEVETSAISLDKFLENNEYTESQFTTLVSSITTSDKGLFPGVGQVILFTEKEDRNFNIKGLLVKSPTIYDELIYVPLEKLNEGKSLDVLFATKYGMRLSALKIKLLKSKKVSPEYGGVLSMKILKNGLFKSYHSFKLKLVRVHGEWEGLIHKKRKFVSFKSIHLKASKVGVKKVEFY